MTLYFETTTWIAVGAAVGAVAIALVVAIVLMVLVVRSGRNRHDPDVERTLEESDARFEQMLEGLSRELLRAREESQRSQRFASLGGSIDLDSVTRHLVEAALDLAPAEAAMVVVSQPGNEPVVATAGMTAEEAERQLVGSPPDGGETRAITINYRYADESADDEALIRGGLMIPLMTDREPIGSLGVFWRGARAAAFRAGAPRARGVGHGGGASDRERPPVPRGAAAGRPRFAHEPVQPPLLSRRSRP